MDENTNLLIKNTTLKINTNLKKDKIDIINIENKKMFILCLDTSATSKIVKENLIKLMQKLKEILNTQKIFIFSISRNIEILNLSWEEIEEVLKDNFENSNIKVIICLNNIEYVSINDRNRIVDTYHSSTIGEHSGINRTYNRIKEKYFWENLKSIIQNRLNKCEICQRNKLKQKEINNQ